jgi:hypothetical protein
VKNSVTAHQVLIFNTYFLVVAGLECLAVLRIGRCCVFSTRSGTATTERGELASALKRCLLTVCQQQRLAGDNTGKGGKER